MNMLGSTIPLGVVTAVAPERSGSSLVKCKKSKDLAVLPY